MIIIYYYVFIGIWYIVLPLHLRVSILKYCDVNAALLFLDNPVRTVRPVLVTRPNQVPTIILLLLLLYYTVCLYFILRVLLLSWFDCAEAAAEYHESLRDFDVRKHSRFSIETATHILLNAMIIFCATTWFRNTTNVMFDYTFFTLLSNARIVIYNH